MGDGYALHARYYDRVYAFKDYAAEATALRAIVAIEGVTGRRWLDAACGTGAHLAHLRSGFEVEGFDAEPAMLELARAKLPGVRLWHDDLTRVALTPTYDVISCLFGAVGHVYPEARLQAAISALARGLRPGGVLLVEPWLTPEQIDPRGRAAVGTWQDPDDEEAGCRAIVSRTDGAFAVLDTSWVIARRGAPIERFDEQLRLRLYANAELAAAFAAVGLTARLAEFGRSGLWVATRAGCA